MGQFAASIHLTYVHLLERCVVGGDDPALAMLPLRWPLSHLVLLLIQGQFDRFVALSYGLQFKRVSLLDLQLSVAPDLAGGLERRRLRYVFFMLQH